MVLEDSSLPRLYAPPTPSNVPGQPIGIGAWRFPEWFIVQEAPAAWRAPAIPAAGPSARHSTKKGDLMARWSWRLASCVPVPKGHVDDIDWHVFIHGPDDNCRRQLWLDEFGTSGDLSDLRVRCECGQKRGMQEAKDIGANPLGTCKGARPWLGKNANEPCKQPSRLLIRTASNAYFPQVMSVLSLPDRGSEVENVVAELWDDLEIVDGPAILEIMKRKKKVAEGLAPFSDDEVIEAINQREAWFHQRTAGEAGRVGRADGSPRGVR